MTEWRARIGYVNIAFEICAAALRTSAFNCRSRRLNNAMSIPPMMSVPTTIAIDGSQASQETSAARIGVDGGRAIELSKVEGLQRRSGYDQAA